MSAQFPPASKSAPEWVGPTNPDLTRQCRTSGRKRGTNGSVTTRVGKPQKYRLNAPYDFAPHSPWFEDWFQDIYTKSRGRTLMKEDSAYVIHQVCRHCLHLDGDFAECGVYKGGSAFLIAWSLAQNGATERRWFHVFDTFQGMPPSANADPSGIKQGRFGDTSLSAVQEYLKEFPFVRFHHGYIPTTLDPVKDRRFAFVHIDVDLYQTTKDCLDSFCDRIVPGRVMIFDDCGWAVFTDSEKRAVDEFLANKREVPVSLRSGQCIVIKL
ncbi:MAG: TylF/MycF/NovP-related O-methyltransferase [Dehalococcoidia bacterium]|nr:TylF/MycF/NovP-related O-methyltransferase [Dehalococcoidia bacterium]